ncbi:Glucan 1,3-beta-glucosidase [Zancudomyces culisetae]|uniref:glucan endo-1,3-beta-D-glucosidase n=1 Tax=Zancudomyces culisetae TaxID=1213189 RepID=A0A1R1PDD5_ZANCU|nr:Glucan 1,3-beta-glucosidase [Zancudomyces culisetae]|eukprot:OMH78882.1 Glucan 1,3-beta-glucosidase [Zancudomyces culisetae]
MKLNDMLVLAIAAASGVSASTDFWGLNYNPKRADGSCANVYDVMNDLNALSNYTDTIRIYSVKDCNHGEPVLRAIENTDWKVYLGLWVGEGDLAYELDKAELRRLSQYFDLKRHVQAIIVGSESIYRGEHTTSDLAAKITDTKMLLEELGLGEIPVTTADVGYLMDSTVIDAVDFVMTNGFPYWEGLDVNIAAEQFYKHLDELIERAGGKKVMVSETGWPTNGEKLGNAVPSTENSLIYMRDFICEARARNLDYLWFSAIDAPWTNMPGEPPNVEAYFGILTPNYTPKYPGDPWFTCENNSTTTSSSSLSPSMSTPELSTPEIFTSETSMPETFISETSTSEIPTSTPITPQFPSFTVSRTRRTRTRSRCRVPKTTINTNSCIPTTRSSRTRRSRRTTRSRPTASPQRTS